MNKPPKQVTRNTACADVLWRESSIVKAQSAQNTKAAEFARMVYKSQKSLPIATGKQTAVNANKKARFGGFFIWNATDHQT